MSVKETIKNVYDSLPDDAGWDEVQYRLYLGILAGRSNEETKLELSQEEIHGIIEEEDDSAYRRYVSEAIEEGLRELDAGQGIPHEEAGEIMKSWFK